MADDLIDGIQAAMDLILKIDGIVDHMQIGVAAPRAERAVVHFAGALHRLIPRLIAEIIGKFRALGAGDQMQDGIVVREDLGLRCAEACKDLTELLVRDIGLVVEERPIVDHKDVFLRHHLRGLEREALLV